MAEVSTYQVSGVLLACETDGPPDGPPLMLLHALGEDRTSWRVLPGVAVQRNAPRARHWDGLAEITAPTLIIAGGPRSHLRQDELAQVAEGIPGARLTTIDAGHMCTTSARPYTSPS